MDTVSAIKMLDNFVNILDKGELQTVHIPNVFNIAFPMLNTEMRAIYRFLKMPLPAGALSSASRYCSRRGVRMITTISSLQLYRPLDERDCYLLSVPYDVYGKGLVINENSHPEKNLG